MIGNLITILVLIALLVLFAWLARRAWRARNAIVKWVGVVLAGLLTLILALATIVAAVGFFKLYVPSGNPVTNVKVQGTPDQIARGQKFANLCAGCHSTATKLPLDGANDNFVGGLGTVVPPNLTPAGPLKDWSDGEIIRAIREGVHQNGRALIIMPSETFHNYSDADVQAVVAYLRSQPAVNHDTPTNDLGPVAMFLVGAGIFPTAVQQPITQPVIAPPAGVTADYGKYLVDVSGCRVCHGEYLAGGKPGGFTPVGPNLTVIVPKWNSDADFVKTIRTGVDPTGHTLNPDMMPYKELSAMYTDDELRAIYQYVHGLAPLPANH